MRITVLGDIGIAVGVGPVVPVTAPRPRALLARLCVQPNEVVSADALVDAAWPDGGPRSARTALQTHLSVLRDLFEPGRPRRSPGSFLETSSDGYLLRVDVDHLDAVRFEQLVEAARRSRRAEPDRASAAIADALALWSEPPFADLGHEHWALGAVARLTEARRSAGELRFGLALEAGRDAEVIGALAAEIERFPHDERLIGQLMFAQYRTGRQDDALRTYRTARRRLVDDLGVEPGEQLRRLEHRILTQDPALRRGTPTRADDRRHRSADGHGLVGRAAELDEIERALTSDQLVALVGPAGTGKTRLALEIGARRQGQRSEAVVVDLAPVVEGDVARVIARALGLVEQPFDDVVGQIVDALQDAGTLLILDNADHVAGAVTSIAGLLIDSCAVRVLVTSRVALRDRSGSTAGTRLDIAPLDLDDAIRLLELRAERRLSDDERQVAPELVRRLDGLPLALELAAHRLTTVSVQELLTIAERPGALASESLDPRHGTIDRAIRWSTDQLPAPVWEALLRLSMFAGPFVHTAAEQLIVEDPVSEEEVLGALGDLAERSLLAIERSGDVTWFRMLETVRAHLRRQLAERGDLDHWRLRHADWVHGAIGRSLRRRAGAVPPAALHEEVGSALNWIEATAPGGHDHLRLVTGLAGYWHETGRISEGRDRLRAALRADSTNDPILRAIALADAGSLAWWQGGFRELDEVTTEAIALARSAGATVFADLLVAARAVVRREFDAGARHLERALADASLSRATKLALLHVGGDIEWYRGNHAAAADHFGREVVLGEELGSGDVVARGQRCQGLMLAYAGRTEFGWSLCSRALDAAVESGSELSLAQSHAHCAATAMVVGDEIGARQHASNALQRSVRQFDVRAILVAVPVLARLLLDGGDAVAVARLTGWFQAMRDETTVVPPPPGIDELDLVEAEAKDRLGPRWGVLRTQGAGWRLPALLDAVGVAR